MSNSASKHTQAERHQLGQTLGSFGIGDFEVFPLREGETPQVAATRLRASLMHWKPTMYSRWSCKPGEGCVVVKKIGEWPRF